jgi:hypothetical protein
MFFIALSPAGRGLGEGTTLKLDDAERIERYYPLILTFSPQRRRKFGFFG